MLNRLSSKTDRRRRQLLCKFIIDSLFLEVLHIAMIAPKHTCKRLQDNSIFSIQYPRVSKMKIADVSFII